MPLSLRQKAAIIQNQNARERVRMAISDIANAIATETPAEGASEAAVTLVNRRVAFAGALMAYGSNWIDQVFNRIISIPAVAALGAYLAMDSNLLGGDDEANMDDVLLTAIGAVYNSLIPTNL